MMVFFKKRLVLLSVPKTGSTALQAALGAHAELMITAPPELKHAPVFRYNRFVRPMYKQVCNTDLELIAVMREPISWLGSWWRYRQRDDLRGHPNATHDIDFDSFVRAYVEKDRPGFANVGSQERFLRRQENGVGVNHLFRYEDGALLRFLEYRLGVPIETTLHNPSPQGPLDLSPRAEAMLRRKASRDFDLYASIPKDGSTAVP